MTREEKDLLIKDLCARLPYNVIIRCTDNDADYKCFLTTDILNELLHNIEYYDYKPYLRPMSSMTERERRKFDSFCVIDEEAWKGNGIIGFKNQARIMAEAIDWLNAHHFDYRGLIEKGLALEAPEGMYKTE